LSCFAFARSGRRRSRSCCYVIKCDVPAGLSGVTAIAAGAHHSLALKSDGTVVAWGCGGIFPPHKQCSVPAGLSGVTAIDGDGAQSLAVVGHA
jgi:alpha-tubulin suppressor-like RCC1 family protein